MGSKFDGYEEWLEIPPDRRPPSYYALLGVDEFESDLEKIEEAFQQRYSLVRRYQVGKNSAEAVRILTEMSRAYDCLTSPHHKSRYDKQLKSSGAKAADQDELALADESSSSAPASTPKKKPTARVEILDDDEEDTPAAPQDATPKRAASPGGGRSAPSSSGLELLPDQDRGPQAELVWFIQTPDGRRLGPATQQQLDQVVKARKVNPQSKLWRKGWTEAAPALQVFPELAEVNGQPAELRPYRRSAASQESKQSRMAVFYLVLVLGLVLAATALVMRFFFSLDFLLMSFLGLLGLAAMAGGFLEASAVMNSPLAAPYRRRLGDEGARKLFGWVGLMCVVVALGMGTLQTFGRVSQRLRGVGLPGREMANLPGIVNNPGRSRPGPGNRSLSEAPATGAPPVIGQISSYVLREGQPITIRGAGLKGTTKVIFAQPGAAKSSNAALPAEFDAVSDSQLKVTVPLGVRFGRHENWVCEIHSNGAVAVTAPPGAHRVTPGRSAVAPPRSFIRMAPGAEAGPLNNSIVVLDGRNQYAVLMFSRVYVLGQTDLRRGCNANVLVGPSKWIGSSSPSNQKIAVAGGVRIFPQPQPFTIN